MLPLARFLWTPGFIAFVTAVINAASFFALLEPGKSVNEVPTHGLAEGRKDAPDLLPDYFSGYVHLAQQRYSLIVPACGNRPRKKLVRSMPQSASDGPCGTVGSANH